MKITALLVVKSPSSSESADPVVLANASNVSQFGHFETTSAKEFILVVARTVTKRTPPCQRHSVQHEDYKVLSYNRNGLCALAFVDDHYPVRGAFSLLNMVLDEFQKTFGDSWRAVKADATQPWPFLTEALKKFQDPSEADKLLKIQRDLDETKVIIDPADADKLLKIQRDLDETKVIIDPAEADKLLKIQRDLDEAKVVIDPAEADKLLEIRRDLDDAKVIILNTIDRILEREVKLDRLVDGDLSAASQMFYMQAKKTNQCCTIL